MKYRKRPVVIEAFQFDGGSNTRRDVVPIWFVDAIMDGAVRAAPEAIFIKTLEGEMRGDLGDWIIKGIKGEIYPCKPDVFAATYEAVPDSEAIPDA